MSEATPETPAAPVESEKQEPAAAAPAQPESPKPPWGSDDEFNPEKAWSRIQQQSRDIDKLRSELKEAQPKLDEYKRLEEASQTDLERAQNGEKAARERVQSLLRETASAKVEAALAGLPDEMRKTLLEDMNVDRFIKDDGVDAEGISALRERYAPFVAQPERPGMKPNPAQGASASPAPTLQGQIAQAQEAGDFRTSIALKARQAVQATDN